MIKKYHDKFLPHLSWYHMYHFCCFIIYRKPRVGFKAAALESSNSEWVCFWGCRKGVTVGRLLSSEPDVINPVDQMLAQVEEAFAQGWR